jgi:hypothetical protein
MFFKFLCCFNLLRELLKIFLAATEFFYILDLFVPVGVENAQFFSVKAIDRR